MALESASQVSSTVRKSDIILFTFQISLVFLISVCSLVNLTLGIGNQNLWTALLTSCLGYVMPNPKIKVVNGQVEIYKRSISDSHSRTSLAPVGDGSLHSHTPKQ